MGKNKGGSVAWMPLMPRRDVGMWACFCYTRCWGFSGTSVYASFVNICKWADRAIPQFLLLKHWQDGLHWRMDKNAHLN
jgi:hypothetical protein